MLVLSRRLNERIMIGEDIVLTVVDIRDGKVRIGVQAPVELRVDREEIREQRDAERRREEESR